MNVCDLHGGQLGSTLCLDSMHHTPLLDHHLDAFVYHNYNVEHAPIIKQAQDSTRTNRGDARSIDLFADIYSRCDAWQAQLP